MRSSFAILVFSITLLGCSSSYIVSSSSTSETFSYSEFNSDAKDRSATIVFQDSSTLDCQEVIAGVDSTSWLQLTGARVAVSTHKIKKVMLTNRTLGALEGAGIGFLSGGVTGLLVAVPIVAANSQDEFAGIAYVVFPAIGGTAGLLVGPVIGGISGHTYEYNFMNELEKQSNLGIPSLVHTSAQAEKGSFEIGIEAGPLFFTETNSTELSFGSHVDYFLTDKLSVGATGLLYYLSTISFGGAYSYINYHFNSRHYALSAYIGGRIGVFQRPHWYELMQFAFGAQTGLQYFVARQVSVNGQLDVGPNPVSGILLSLGIGLSYHIK